MKIQWNLILALLFALIVAILAVANVEAVQIDYVFGSAEMPLILIILGSALLGGLMIGSIGLFRSFMLQRQVKLLTTEKAELEVMIHGLKQEVEALHNYGLQTPKRHADMLPEEH